MLINTTENNITFIVEFPKGLKLTQAGLLLHESGKHVTYEEVQARRLLDYLDIFEHVKDEAILRDSNTKKSEGNGKYLLVMGSISDLSAEN